MQQIIIIALGVCAGLLLFTHLGSIFGSLSYFKSGVAYFIKLILVRVAGLFLLVAILSALESIGGAQLANKGLLTFDALVVTSVVLFIMGWLLAEFRLFGRQFAAEYRRIKTRFGRSPDQPRHAGLCQRSR